MFLAPTTYAARERFPELRSPDSKWSLCSVLGSADNNQIDFSVRAIFAGDDVTDEDAFRALKGKGIGIRIGDEKARCAYNMSGHGKGVQ